MHGPSGANLASAVLVGVTLFAAGACAAPAPVLSAVNSDDITALEALARSARTMPQRNLAEGALLALRHRDHRALVTLIRVARSRASRTVRATADVTLAGVYLRDQRYAACYRAVRTAARLSAASVDLGTRQNMAICHVLAAVKPMRLVRETPGRLPVTRDRAGLMRVPVTIDGRRYDGVVDTGANMSTVSASTAQRAGIRVLGKKLSVHSPSEASIAMRLGIARRLKIGNVTLADVVFIVLPDAALNLGDGYRISAIIGLPVWMALGRRLELVNSATPVLRYDVQRIPATSLAAARSPMLLSVLKLMVLVHVPQAHKSLPMILDSGAGDSSLSRAAIANAPLLLARARRQVLHYRAAGGGVTEPVLRVPELQLGIGGRRFELKNVPLTPDRGAGSKGRIGQDILRQGSGWIMNFKAMTLAAVK